MLTSHIYVETVAIVLAISYTVSNRIIYIYFIKFLLSMGFMHNKYDAKLNAVFWTVTPFLPFIFGSNYSPNS